MQTKPFGIEVICGSDTKTISLFGEMDYFATIELSSKLETIVSNTETNIILNMEHVVLVDSEAIKMLIKLFELAKQNSKNMRIEKCSCQAKRIMSLAGVSEIFCISESPDISGNLHCSEDSEENFISIQQ